MMQEVPVLGSPCDLAWNRPQEGSNWKSVNYRIEKKQESSCHFILQLNAI